MWQEINKVSHTDNDKTKLHLKICVSLQQLINIMPTMFLIKKKNFLPSWHPSWDQNLDFWLDVIEDTHRLCQPCCRRRARQNPRCRTWQRPRSDLFQCTALRTAPSSGGESCSAAPYHLAVPWGHTAYCADGISSSDGGEPASGQAGTSARPQHVLCRI